MAITRDSFRNIPSSGVIPDAMLPAREWAVSYAFSYEIDAAETVPRVYLNTTLVLYVYSSDDTLKYVVTIQERYFYIIMSAAASLMFYSWQWVPTAEKIVGRKGDDPTAPDAPLMTTLGQGTFGMEPAQGSGISNQTALIETRYYSVIFQEPLEHGDYVEVKHYTVDTSPTAPQARLQLATELGAGVSCALRDPRVGTVWHVAPEGNTGSRIANTRRDAAFERKTATLVTERRPIYARAMRQGATMHFLMVYPVQGGTNLGVLTSLDGGATWENNDMLLDNFQVLAARLAPDGGTMWLYGLAPSTATGASPNPVPSRAILKRGEGGWKASDKVAVRLLTDAKTDADPSAPAPAPLPRTGVVTLESSGNTLHLVAGGDKGGGGTKAKLDPVRIWESTDELASLREMKITDDEAAADAADDGG